MFSWCFKMLTLFLFVRNSFRNRKIEQEEEKIQKEIKVLKSQRVRYKPTPKAAIFLGCAAVAMTDGSGFSQQIFRSDQWQNCRWIVYYILHVYCSKCIDHLPAWCRSTQKWKFSTLPSSLEASNSVKCKNGLSCGNLVGHGQSGRWSQKYPAAGQTWSKRWWDRFCDGLVFCFDMFSYVFMVPWENNTVPFEGLVTGELSIPALGAPKGGTWGVY